MTQVPEANWVSERWKLLLKIGAWIATLVGGFLLLPPYLDPSAASAFTKLGQFLAASLAGLLLLPLTVWASPRFVSWWWMLGVALLGASLWAYFHYNTLIGRDTVPYDVSRVVAGSEAQYTAEARDYVQSLRQQGQPATRSVVVMDFAGRTDEIWPEDVLLRNETRLIKYYFLALGLFSSFAVVLAHIVGTALGSGKPEEPERDDRAHRGDSRADAPR